MGDNGERKVTRKEFLRTLAVFGGAALTGGLLSSCKDKHGGAAGTTGGTGSEPTTLAYKLSNRKKVCCKACKNHAHYKRFASSEAAADNRPHAGCNCEIKTVRMTVSEYNACFPNGSQVYDPRVS